MSEQLVPYSLEENEETINMLNRYKKFMANIEFSDVKIKVNDCKIPAHKLVLCAQSNVFYSYFRDGVENEEKATGIVEIEGFNVYVVYDMLRFIYTGHVDQSSLNIRLLGIAAKYNIVELKNKCMRHLISALSVVNAIEILFWSDHYGCTKLREEAMEFICMNADEVIESREWKEMLKRTDFHHLNNEIILKMSNRLKDEGISLIKRARK